MGMRSTAEDMEHSPAEKPAETTSGVRDTGRAKSAGKSDKPLQDKVAIDSVVNEVMIRRIMAALMSPE